MEPTALATYLLAAGALVVVPGPDWALVLATGLRGSRVAPVVLGLALGYVVLTGAVAAGLAPLVAAVPAALAVLTAVGGAYLVWTGAAVLRAPAPSLVLEPVTVGAPARPVDTTSVRQGVGVSALNPKSLLFFVAFLPQFARPEAPWPIVVQLLVLGAFWVLLTSVFYGLLGTVVLGARTRAPHLAARTSRVAGAVMVAAGLGLLAELVLRGPH